MFSTMKLESFLEDLSSNLPAPGGGAAAAVSGCMGASLVAMVCNLTTGKKAYQEVETLMQQTILEAADLRDELLQMADQDAQAFNALMASYKTEGTPQEKAETVQRHLKLAAEVPWRIALACERVLMLAESIAGKSNPNLNSDIEVAVEMALAGMRSGAVNVRVNLGFIKDAAYNEGKERSIIDLLTVAGNRQGVILQAIGK